jgi:hypothetical protein
MAAGLLGRRKNYVQQKPKRIHLTPTGLLMEGDYTQNPYRAILSVMAIYCQLKQIPNYPFGNH